MRRRTLLALGLPLALPETGWAAPAAADPRPSAAVALARLADGNRRFAEGRARHPHQHPHRQHRLASGQQPFVVTLGCADSRVAPEILFDQGLGDVFDNRVAGNVADELVTGSIEYALEHFEPPLVVVLGHERCGAVTAALEALRGSPSGPGHVGVIVRHLRPSVEAVLGRPGDVVANAVRANVAAQAGRLRRSPLIAARVQTARLRVVGAVYDLDTGKVSFM